MLDYLPLIAALSAPIVSGFGGYAVANRMARSAERVARINHEPERGDDASTGSLTRRFQVLLDGYEGHIQSLTAEVQGLRAEVRDLQQLMLERCAKCPYRLAAGDAHA
jgi:hypothetical protein